MKRLFIDTETGGTDPKTASLLTLGLCVWENGHIYDAVEFALQADMYHVSAGALFANKINLLEHHDKGQWLDKFRASINTYLNKWFGMEKIWLAGHNTQFDRDFLLATMPELRARFHYRLLDTSTILNYWQDLGYLPAAIGGGMEEAMGHFNMPLTGLHNAKQDALTAAYLYNRLLEIPKDNAMVFQR